jgi:hypothetical protein
MTIDGTLVDRRRASRDPIGGVYVGTSPKSSSCAPAVETIRAGFPKR